MEQHGKKTLLHSWHIAHGANMALFGGYEMPLWYPAGVKKEHLSVLTHAGLFDTSHMAVVTITGHDAFNLLQYCFTKDLSACVGKQKSPLTPGKCVYGAFLNQHGETIDDAIVYHLQKDAYLVVVNAGMGRSIADHLSQHKGDGKVDIQDMTDKVGKLDIQGPKAAKILGSILADPEKTFEKMSYFSFKGYFVETSLPIVPVRLKDNTPIMVSRSGYTGEFGFELFIEPAQVVRLWEMILKAGEKYGIICCGLGARDSLRAGAVLPLSHQDIGHWTFINHPWPFALPYNDTQTGFTKTFIGSNALQTIDHPEFTHAFVGQDLRKVSTEDPAVVLDAAGSEIGIVLTCATDMGIGRYDGRIVSIAGPDKPKNFEPKGLSCGFVKVKTRLSMGDTIELKDKRRKITVTVVDDVRPDRTARCAMRDMI
jgi:aminomethyltransferase